jgi:ubiquinone biosynthesis O-methyltransferase
MNKHRRSSGIVPVITPDTYAKWRASDLGRITEEIETSLIIELLGDLRDKRVLDIGCGDGVLAVALAQAGAQVIGVDASANMIRAARARAEAEGLNVEFLMGRAEALPFDNESFDVVSAVTVLCFIRDASHTFAEVSRVMRPGGRFVIGELGRLSLWAARRRVRAWLGSPLWRQGYFRTSGELRRLAVGAGLHPLKVHGAIYYPHSDWAARKLSHLDSKLSRLTTFGAAFLALSAVKPKL